MPGLRDFAVIFAVTAVVTLAVTPLCRWAATRTGVVALPDERRVHTRPTPMLGGAAMLVGFLAGMATAWRMDAFDAVFSVTTEPLGLVVATVVIFVVGAVDDTKEVSAPAKMAGIVLAASLLVLSGISILVFRIPFGGLLILAPDLSYLISVIWVIGMANAVNFIDGLDGLAAGLGLIAALAICLFSLGQLRELGGDSSYYPPALITVALAGACLGFLPHNFSPARIFMGDSGAMLIGLMLAAASTSASGRISPNAYGTADVFTLLSPLILVAAIMFIPMLDMLMAVVRRTRAGVGFYTPDKMHLHHRLLELGHSQSRVALLIYLWVGVLALSVSASTVAPLRVVGPVFLVGVVVALVFTFSPRIARAFRD